MRSDPRYIRCEMDQVPGRNMRRYGILFIIFFLVTA